MAAFFECYRQVGALHGSPLPRVLHEHMHHPHLVALAGPVPGQEQLGGEPVPICCTACLSGSARGPGRTGAQAEFEVIYEEAQLASKFAAIDQLCEEQGLCDAPGADGCGSAQMHHIGMRGRPAW